MFDTAAFIENTWNTLLVSLYGLVIPALFFLCLAIIVKGRAWITDIKRALPETGLNVQILIFNTIFLPPILVVATLWLHGVLKSLGLVMLSPDSWDGYPVILVMFFAVFIGDFVGYWRHRFEHSPLLWPSHAVHHSDTEMTWLSLERFHPINRLTTFAIDGTALFLLGFPPYAVTANYLVRHYYGFFIHADLPWTYGALGRVFVSPAMHRWHHAADFKAFNTNYATVFSVFDQIFGTCRVPGPCNVPLGVTDDMGKGFVGQMLYPFRARAYRRLFASKKSN